MKCLGILSVQEEIKGRKGRRIRILERERFFAGISVVVGTFSAAGAELGEKSERAKRRLFHRGMRFLARLGADTVVPTLLCKEVLGIPGGGTATAETAIVPADMPKALKSVLTEYREKPAGKTGWVLDRNCTSYADVVLEEMLPKVQRLALVTRERERAEILEEKLCEEYGVNLEIRESYPWQERENTVVADMDKGCISLDGRVVLNRKKLSWDLAGYSVDLAELLEQYPELQAYTSPCGWCIRKSG